MNKQEFETRIGKEVTEKTFKMYEAMYMACPESVDKDTFVQLLNKDAIPESPESLKRKALAKVKEYLDIIETYPKLSVANGWQKCQNLVDEKKDAIVIIKVAEDQYSKYLEVNKQFIEECGSNNDWETTYVCGPDQKCWRSDCGGYSCFATSLGQILRNNQCDMYDRIERLKYEWFIVVEKSIS